MELTQATSFKEKSIVYDSATLAAVAQKKKKSESPPFSE